MSKPRSTPVELPNDRFFEGVSAKKTPRGVIKIQHGEFSGSVLRGKNTIGDRTREERLTCKIIRPIKRQKTRSFVNPMGAIEMVVLMGRKAVRDGRVGDVDCPIYAQEEFA